MNNDDLIYAMQDLGRKLYDTNDLLQKTRRDVVEQNGEVTKEFEKMRTANLQLHEQIKSLGDQMAELAAMIQMMGHNFQMNQSNQPNQPNNPVVEEIVKHF